jgi:predicted Fe-Mo cluster-binding NifX family protein
MSKAAFSQWNGRIAPVFDVAREVRVVETIDGLVSAETDELLPEDVPANTVTRLVSLGIDTLVCGAVSRPMLDLLRAHSIAVVPFVAGELAEVIQAWLRGGVTNPSFAMPGCGGRGRGRRGQGRFRSREDDAMNERLSGGKAGANRGSQGLGRRGPGSGRKGGPQAAGATGLCVCPACGHREPHLRGVPCVQTTCPACGAAMMRGTADQ